MVLGYLKSYIDQVVPRDPVKFQSKEGNDEKTLAQIIQQSVPGFVAGSSYWLTLGLSSGHLQTVWSALRKFEEIDHIHYKRRVLTVEDVTYTYKGESFKYDHWGGTSTFTIDYVVPAGSDPNHEKYKPASQTQELPPRTEYLDPETEYDLLKDDSRPLVIALHGLTGGSYEAYIRSFMTEITNKPYDFDALVLNSRGCANHTITSPQLFSGLWTNDLRYLINKHILRKWPNKRIYLIGFSLGGAITANYLGQEYDEVCPNIKGATVVAAPWSFDDSSYRLSESLLGNQVYSPAMCKNLMKLLNNHIGAGTLKHHVLDKWLENPNNYSIVKLRDFDDNFTSRLFGFNCADEYYFHASPNQRLSKIRVPTVLLNSKDDPISSYNSISKTSIKLNPYVMLVSTTIGGHIGWFDITGHRWNSRPTAQLFKELDKNWVLDKSRIDPDSLPSDVGKIWSHDRLV